MAHKYPISRLTLARLAMNTNVGVLSKHLCATDRRLLSAILSSASATRPSPPSRTLIPHPRPLHTPSTLMGAPAPGEKPSETGKRTAAGTATMASPPPPPPPSASRAHSRAQIEERARGPPPVASPSASIILVSPSNQILLLHRVRTSSAFPSAHVFPGGNLESSDGTLPDLPTDPRRHMDCLAYRTGAMRELFEESGILLARKDRSSSGLLEVSAADRDAGRREVHSHQTPFDAWLARQSQGQAVLDTDALIPFTHWITPPNVPKRFSTQMYVYFVPVEERGNASVEATSDRVENMAAEWRDARSWLEAAETGEIILFPPQFLLLHLASRYLDGGEKRGEEVLLKKREALRRFIETEGTPPWKDKYISPIGLQFGREDGRAVLGLDKPGLELRGTSLSGDSERVVLVKFNKEGPRSVEVGWRKDVLGKARVEENENVGMGSKI